jgi:hypothetical protein
MMVTKATFTKLFVGSLLAIVGGIAMVFYVLAVPDGAAQQPGEALTVSSAGRA